MLIEHNMIFKHSNYIYQIMAITTYHPVCSAMVVQTINPNAWNVRKRIFAVK